MTEANQEFDGKTVVVTGGTIGIGRAAVNAFAAAGARVIAVGRDSVRGADIVREASGDVRFVAADLSKVGETRRLAETTGPVDVLVTSAGYHSPPGAAAETSEADFAQTLAVNVTAPFFLSAAYAPAMAERGSGAIVHVSSGNATRDQKGFAAYNVSKAALNAVVRAFANEWGPSGVRVNAVAPGPTRTPYAEQFGSAVDELMARTPLGRPGSVEQVSDAILFLASDRSSHTTGAVLPVDGGQLIFI